MTNPIQPELADLISLKSKTDFLGFPSHKNTTIGFGQNKSLFKSRGLNFEEVRQYQPGDDIRQIDWRVTAKYGKPFTKLYTEEKEKQVYILCDLRPNMQFASHGHFKSVMAARLSAFIGFLAEQKNDSLSYQILSHKLIQSLGTLPARDNLPYFLNQLAQENTQTSDVSFNQIIPFMEQNIRPGAIIFLISDFHDITADDFRFLGELSHKNIINFIHLYDNMEVQLPKGILPFSNGQKQILIDTQSKSFQKSFTQSWSHKTDLLRQQVKKYHWGYLSLATDSDYLSQFQHFCLGDLS
jgi:uncharacterized protein (DUF58 family)